MMPDEAWPAMDVLRGEASDDGMCEGRLLLEGNAVKGDMRVALTGVAVGVGAAGFGPQ
jgi:hypothetical protein